MVRGVMKVCKTSLWLLRKGRLRKKSVQIVMGRWIYLMQFRRPAVSHFQEVWKYIGEQEKGPNIEAKVKEEILGAMLGVCLLHTFLGARVDNEITCSDASMTGGAVARAKESFLQSREPQNQPKQVPVAVVSLFNGIGGCYRSYDVAGAVVVGALGVDVHKPANRVVNRRRPAFQQWDDIRTLTPEHLENFLEDLDEFQEIHVWAGFPCVDLSAVKAFRRNLLGSQSSLIFEAIRVMDDLKKDFTRIECIST